MRIWIEVDEDDVLDELSTTDLEDELKRRTKKTDPSDECDNVDPFTGLTAGQMVDAIYQARRNGQDDRVLLLVDRWLYLAMGRIT